MNDFTENEKQELKSFLNDIREEIKSSPAGGSQDSAFFEHCKDWLDPGEGTFEPCPIEITVNGQDIKIEARCTDKLDGDGILSLLVADYVDEDELIGIRTVSYTHLTLQTIYSV